MWLLAITLKSSDIELSHRCIKFCCIAYSGIVNPSFFLCVVPVSYFIWEHFSTYSLLFLGRAIVFIPNFWFLFSNSITLILFLTMKDDCLPEEESRKGQNIPDGGYSHRRPWQTSLINHSTLCYCLNYCCFWNWRCHALLFSGSWDGIGCSGRNRGVFLTCASRGGPWFHLLRVVLQSFSSMALHGPIQGGLYFLFITLTGHLFQPTSFPIEGWGLKDHYGSFYISNSWGLLQTMLVAFWAQNFSEMWVIFLFNSVPHAMATPQSFPRHASLSDLMAGYLHLRGLLYQTMLLTLTERTGNHPDWPSL